MAEDLGDAPGGAIPVRAEVEDLGGDDHAVQVFDRARLDRARANAMNPSPISREGRALRNLDPLPEPLVMRHHEITLAANAELAHHARVGAPQHLGDLSVGAPVAFDAPYAHGHAVAMHAPFGLVFTQVDIALDAGNRLVRKHERITIPI